ncbi:ComEA family DNA-binding protein [Pseudomonas zhanjiangensis]|uniref:ComEA family DNA-binding protein n=1 Tax=Pseudomonas zhanjiangensis TaxID=3239015 RepID=A0ABV3YUL4_9PSED
MSKHYFASLLFAALAATSLATSAADTSKTAPPKAEAVQVAELGKIDLNSADAATLQRELSGIGESKARAIVAYREANGPFVSVDELLEVKGIGQAILSKNRDKLRVD